MFGKKRRQREDGNSNNMGNTSYGKNCCQLCGRKLRRLPGKTVKTSRIKDYYITEEYYQGKMIMKQIPIYEEDFKEGSFVCPVHGAYGVHIDVQKKKGHFF
ncbi:MAG: hypothetical protein Q4E53_07595 [Eubacteriales bacterium]|nr:hypothetical protein [Eubacteriales bacterium]